MSKYVREYCPNGAARDHEKTMTLKELQKGVGGYVEVVHLYGVDIICNEEGKIQRLPFCLSVCGHNFVGHIFVGRFTAKGLDPLDLLEQDAFTSRCSSKPV